MNRQRRKALVRELVASRQFTDLVELAEKDKRLGGVLCGLLFEQDDRFRWRVIEALGIVAAAQAKTNRSSVRELLRRLEWLMNDESGGAGWHSPEAIAAIVIAVPGLIDEFGLLLGSYLHDDALGRGAHWAVAAISGVRPDLFSDRIEELTVSLTSPDPFIRGCAVIGLAALANASVVERTQSLSEDPGALDLYSKEAGELRATTVGEVVKLVAAHAEGNGPGIDVW